MRWKALNFLFSKHVKFLKSTYGARRNLDFSEHMAILIRKKNGSRTPGRDMASQKCPNRLENRSGVGPNSLKATLRGSRTP